MLNCRASFSELNSENSQPRERKIKKAESLRLKTARIVMTKTDPKRKPRNRITPRSVGLGLRKRLRRLRYW